MKKFVSFALALACGFGVVTTVTGCEKTVKVDSRYEITAEYAPENATLAGTTKITFENCGDNEISVLKFQLYPNAYRKDALYRPVSKTYENAAYYKGESYGEMGSPPSTARRTGRSWARTRISCTPISNVRYIPGIKWSWISAFCSNSRT